jgi:hypothetical protein
MPSLLFVAAKAFGIWNSVSAAFGGFPTAVLLTAAIFTESAWTRRRVKDLLDLPATSSAFPVSIVLSFRSIDYGSDVGIVTFVGEWLHFEGIACSFSLKSTELVSDSAVCFEGPAGQSRVNFSCESDRKQFSKEFLAWAWLRSTDGESPLPPITPQAGLQLSTWQRISLLPLQAVMVMLLSELFGFPWGAAFISPFFAGTLFGLAKTYAIRRRLTSAAKMIPGGEDSSGSHLDEELRAILSRIPGRDDSVDQNDSPTTNEARIGREGPS